MQGAIAFHKLRRYEAMSDEIYGNACTHDWENMCPANGNELSNCSNVYERVPHARCRSCSWLRTFCKYEEDRYTCTVGGQMLVCIVT